MEIYEDFECQFDYLRRKPLSNVFVQLSNRQVFRINIQRNKFVNFVKNKTLFFKNEVQIMNAKLLNNNLKDDSIE